MYGHMQPSERDAWDNFKLLHRHHTGTYPVMIQYDKNIKWGTKGTPVIDLAAVARLIEDSGWDQNMQFVDHLLDLDATYVHERPTGDEPPRKRQRHVL